MAWDLVMTGSEAASRRQHAQRSSEQSTLTAMAGGDYDMVLLSDKVVVVLVLFDRNFVTFVFNHI